MRFVLKLGWNAVPLRDQLKRDDGRRHHAVAARRTHYLGLLAIGAQEARRPHHRIAHRQEGGGVNAIPQFRSVAPVLRTYDVA
jgi:hypothetical protein